MKKDPVDHLLMSVHKNFGWGDPFEIFEHCEEDLSAGNAYSTLDAVKYMNKHNMLQQEYHSRPKINLINEGCDYNFTNEKRSSWPKYLFDLLGEYHVERYDKQGQIVLHENCIKEIGLCLFEEFGRTFNRGRQYCIDLVRELILWHELGHWIIHWMKGTNNHRWDTASFKCDKITRDVHEGLAQLFTFYAIIIIEDQKVRSDCMQVFNYLLRDQSPCYHKHNEIICQPNFSWKGVLRGLVMLRIKESSENVTIENLKQEMGNLNIL